MYTATSQSDLYSYTYRNVYAMGTLYESVCVCKSTFDRTAADNV
jgi:hypothetical protein